MPGRTEYAIGLSHVSAADASRPNVRHPSEQDTQALAELMLDAYRGTIDTDGGETLDDARAVITNGNTSSERVFAGIGFAALDTP